MPLLSPTLLEVQNATESTDPLEVPVPHVVDAGHTEPCSRESGAADQASVCHVDAAVNAAPCKYSILHKISCIALRISTMQNMKVLKFAHSLMFMFQHYRIALPKQRRVQALLSA